MATSGIEELPEEVRDMAEAVIRAAVGELVKGKVGLQEMKANFDGPESARSHYNALCDEVYDAIGRAEMEIYFPYEVEGERRTVSYGALGPDDEAHL